MLTGQRKPRRLKTIPDEEKITRNYNYPNRKGLLDSFPSIILFTSIYRHFKFSFSIIAT